jgi:enoyl-CoA hydratase
MELAEQIGANAQIAVPQCKVAIRASQEVDIDAGCELEVSANAVCFATEDKLEGMTAFLEKRAEKSFKYR